MAAKAALRAEARARRKALSAEVRADAAMRVARILNEGLSLRAGTMIAGYAAAGSELDLAPTFAALARPERQFCLPVVVERGQPLEFHTWRPGSPLVPGNGSLVPLGGQLAVPDILLVPLLAFDERLRRLGQGGGYYDRTLAALRSTRQVIAIGVAFAAQQVPLVPCGPEDAELDAIITEAGTLVGTG
jgi:5-formyltetrahydrofolate cyclo-ligase